MHKSYSIIMGQCRKLVQSKVKGMPDYPVISEIGETIILLGGIKTIMFNSQSEK